MLQVHAWTPMDDGLHHVLGAGAGTWYYCYLSPCLEGAQRLALRAHTLIFVWKKLNTRAPWGRQLGSAHHGAPGHHPTRALAAEAVSFPPQLCSAPFGPLSDPSLLQGPAWQGEEWPRRAEQLGAVINRAWHRS